MSQLSIAGMAESQRRSRSEAFSGQSDEAG
jgi:hypothetical protein